MTKLNEIEQTFIRAYDNGSSKELARLAVKHVWLLIRAVRQLGNERNAYQGLVDAVDDRFNEFDIDSDIRQALRALSRISDPDRDVLELIAKKQSPK